MKKHIKHTAAKKIALRRNKRRNGPSGVRRRARRMTAMPKGFPQAFDIELLITLSDFVNQAEPGGLGDALLFADTLKQSSFSDPALPLEKWAEMFAFWQKARDGGLPIERMVVEKKVGELILIPTTSDTDDPIKHTDECGRQDGDECDCGAIERFSAGRREWPGTVSE